ncbi:MAG: ribosome maturation factor [Nitrospirae bacterium CG17_big_fil_post_rev_8_21_14_2_50_50_9]|nr:MAG: ribosome maturation factor [Nitrospirae bacterium CG17_big_fil_post_rev_8_21_14_2_50_50_9]
MSITEKVRDLAIPILDSFDLELFDIELQKGGNRRILRIFIDKKEGGVTLDDCQRASREIEVLLDVKDVVPGSYVLEVSSPGINRTIRSEYEFQKYAGSQIKVKLLTKISDQKIFIGIDRGVDAESLRLEIEPGKEMLIPMKQIVKANLEADFRRL